MSDGVMERPLVLQRLEVFRSRLADARQTRRDAWLLGRVLRLAREAEGISLGRLARDSRVATATLSDVELGKRAVSARVLDAYLDLLTRKTPAQGGKEG